MPPAATYDAIANWYEQEFLAAHSGAGTDGGRDPLCIRRALRDLHG